MAGRTPNPAPCPWYCAGHGTGQKKEDEVPGLSLWLRLGDICLPRGVGCLPRVPGWALAAGTPARAGVLTCAEVPAPASYPPPPGLPFSCRCAELLLPDMVLSAAGSPPRAPVGCPHRGVSLRPARGPPQLPLLQQLPHVFAALGTHSGTTHACAHLRSHVAGTHAAADMRRGCSPHTRCHVLSHALRLTCCHAVNYSPSTPPQPPHTQASPNAVT